jgi:hypothetical protein
MELAGLRHDLQFGADAEYRLIYRSDLLRQAASSTFSYLNPIYGLEQPSATVSASDSDQRDQLHNQSLFLQDAIHLSDRWVLTTGLRYQTWRQTAGRGRPFKANTQADGTAWLPRAGLVYRLDNGLSLYGNYSQSLRPTSTIAPLASGTIIDSGVAPEEARSWEVGAKLDLPGQLTGTLALFDIRKKNVLVSQFNDATKLTDWRTSGAARSRGLEVDVAGELAATGAPSRPMPMWMPRPRRTRSTRATSCGTWRGRPPRCRPCTTSGRCLATCPEAGAGCAWAAACSTWASARATRPIPSGCRATPWPTPSPPMTRGSTATGRASSST